MSAIFYANDEQRRIAEAHPKRARFTELAPLEKFWLAEHYHQKYYLSHHDELMGEFSAAAYAPGDFVESTVAARLNGIVAGDADEALLRDELARYGLSPAAQAHLLATCERRRRR